MIQSLVDAYVSFLARWVGRVQQHALIVILAALIVTAGAGYITASGLKINTDTADMLSRDLDYRQTYIAYKEAFPQFADNIVLVVDGATADRADTAARLLVGKMRAEMGEKGAGRFKSVFYPAGDPFFRKHGLLYLDVDDLDRLLARLAEAQPLIASLTEDLSLRGLATVMAEAAREIGRGEEAPGDFELFLDHMGAVVDKASRDQPGRMPWREVMESPADVAEARRRIIVAQPVLDYGRLDPARPAMEWIREAQRDLGLVPQNGVKIGITGSAALETEELESVAAGAETAALISLVLVSVLLVVGLGSFRMVAAALVTLVMGLVWTAAFATLAIGHLNLISVAFAVLFIGLGVDFAIHFALRYREAARAGSAPDEALALSARGVGAALTLSAVAAAIGFLSFVPTSYVGISELGVISSAGMAIALVASLTVLPALLRLWPPRFPVVKVSPAKSARATSPALTWLARQPRPVLALALLAALASLTVLPAARFDFDTLSLRDPQTQSMRTLADLTEASDQPVYTISVLAPDLGEARAIASRLDALPEVDGTITAASFVPANQGVKLELVAEAVLFLGPALAPAEVTPESPLDRRAAVRSLRQSVVSLAALDRFPELSEAAAYLADAFDQFLLAEPDDADFLDLESRLLGGLDERLADLRLALSTEGVVPDDLPDSLVARYMAADGRARVEVLPRDDLRDNESLTRFVEAVRAVAPDATDSPVILLESGRAVVKALVEALVIALIGITILLVIVLRSFADTLLVLGPLALAAILTAATSVLLGQAFNFANVIVLPLLLGLGVASAIHLVLRSRESATTQDLLASSTPRAVMFSALTTVGSFGSLAISSHRGTASMGLLLSLAILFTLVATLVVLPALLDLRARRRAGRL